MRHKIPLLIKREGGVLKGSARPGTQLGTGCKARRRQRWREPSEEPTRVVVDAEARDRRGKERVKRSEDKE